MSRCDYCEYRNSYDCGDGYNRIGDKYLCDNFKLDFDQLSDKQKKSVQRVLMTKEYEQYG